MASLNSAQSSVQTVESLTHRRVTIETELNEANLSKCHHQEQSQLFTLPLEIRDFIWHYATEPYDDPKFTFDPRADYHPVTFSPAGAFYDLSYKADQLSCVSLLQTCRRVWLETNRLPLEKAKLSCAVLSGGDLMKPLRRDAKGEFIPIEGGWFYPVSLRNLQQRAHTTFQISSSASLPTTSRISLTSQWWSPTGPFKCSASRGESGQAVRSFKGCLDRVRESLRCRRVRRPAIPAVNHRLVTGRRGWQCYSISQLLRGCRR